MSDIVVGFPRFFAKRAQNLWALLAQDAYIIVPCFLILIYSSSLVIYQLPNNFDTLSESFEPLKTLKFVHSRGQAFHKWGPMPNFIYAPLYAPLIAYWYWRGDLRAITTNYPYGFRRPFEQQGDLIAVARSAGLVIAVVSLAMYGRALERLTGSRLAVFLALMLCVATSSRLVFDFVATRPDGLMLAFLAASMAVFVDIIAKGLRWRRGCLLSLLAVCSISCKELTVAVYVPLYLGLGLWGAQPSEDSERRRFVTAYFITIAFGIGMYLLLNVAYAPDTWRLRIIEWTSGPGKDPAVWAPPGYTASLYLRDVLEGILANLGVGGLVISAAALAIAVVSPMRNRFLLWVPASGFAVMMVMLTRGYTPDYFLSPLNVALVLPVSAAFASAGRSLAGSQARRAVALTIVAVLCAVNAWTANAVWVRASLAPPALIEQYCLAHVSRQDLIHTANLWPRQPGADRLSYLGFDVDDCSLAEILTRPARMPDVILIGQEEITWIQQFKIKPARDEMLASTGYHYRDFRGLEALGYHLTDVMEPRVPRFLDFPWVRSLCVRPESSVLVFRQGAYHPGSSSGRSQTDRT